MNCNYLGYVANDFVCSSDPSAVIGGHKSCVLSDQTVCGELYHRQRSGQVSGLYGNTLD